MNRLITILTAISALLIQSPAIAGEPSNAPAKAAEQFYAGYLILVNATKDTTPSWQSRTSSPQT